MIEIEDLALGGAVLFRMPRFHDNRGWFAEMFNDRWLKQLGIGTTFVQDNVCWSEHADTLRGLHAQRAPMAQAKLVSVAIGSVFDVVVDCRQGSQTYGQFRTTVLSAHDGRLLYIPRGFCHGYLTLAPSTAVYYKVDNYYSPEHEAGVRWDDSKLGIAWPLDGRVPILSDRDRALPLFSDFRPL